MQWHVEMLEQVQEDIKQCKYCHLCNLIPEMTTPVPGVGPHNAKIMFVGEAPGEDEQLFGEPFVGVAGKLLNKMLKEAGIDRKKVYICNTVNCNPRVGNKNRPPTDDEISYCKKWLWLQMKFINPNLICTLGKISTYTLLSRQVSKDFRMKDVFGKSFKVSYISSIIIPAWHPSYLLQHGKNKVKDEVKLFKKIKEKYYA